MGNPVKVKKCCDSYTIYTFPRWGDKNINNFLHNISDINECDSNPCKPGDTCYNSVGSHNCRSKEDYCSTVTDFVAYYENEDACCKMSTLGETAFQYNPWS